MLKVRDFLKDQEKIESVERPISPKVSIIMPVYSNNGMLLRRAVESVIAQIFEDFELIIVDDGSHDGTFDTVKEYAEQDSRIVILRHENNSGLPAIRVNEGILESRGEYISYQFDDDEYLPTHLERLYSFIIQKDHPCVVYGATTMHIDLGEEKIIRELGTHFNYGILWGSNQIGNNTVMHHRNVMDLCGMYCPHISMRKLCDYDLWLRMGKCVPFYFIGEKISNVYVNQKNSIGKLINNHFPMVVRKILEIDRTEKLLPQNIMEYDVDDFKQFGNTFDEDIIDAVYRREIFPFLSRTTYLLSEVQRQIFNISRRKTKSVTAFKSDFSTSVDVTLKNFLTRTDVVPYSFSFLKANDSPLLKVNEPDVSIFYRSLTDVERNYMDHCKKHGYSTAYWIDDNMFHFYKDGPAFAHFAPGSNYYKNIEYIVATSDTVVSYNPIISEDCIRYNKNIIEMQTNIPAKYLVEKQSLADGRIHFAVFSGEVRREIFQQLWSGLERFTEKYATMIDITFWGIDPESIGVLACPVYHQPFTHSYDQYLDCLVQSNFDFHITPLSGHRITDISKSPIKYLEGTAAGAVGIFSAVRPYRNLPDDMCIKVENTSEAWYQALCNAAEMPKEVRQEMYQSALKDIKNRFTTEAQVTPFITALDSTQLHCYLGKKKIAYVIHESYLGGATLHLLRHALLLRSLNFEIMLCLPENQKSVSDFPLLAKKYGIEVHYLPCRRSVTPVNRSAEDYNNAIEISKFFELNKVGMIHAATYMPALGIVAEQLGIPNVATLHQYYPSETNYENDSNIQIIHSSSNRYAAEWQRIFMTPAIRIVCPVSDEFFHMYQENLLYNIEQTQPKSTVHILVSGTLQPRKNQLSAIRAAALLRERGIKVQLDLIGYDHLWKNYTDECKTAIEELGLQDAVTIHGFDDSPEKYYKQTSQILLCCAEDESMPQTILQAMATGVLVVSTDCGGVREIIKDGYNGVIAYGFEPNHLADAIEHICCLSDDKKRTLLNNAQDTIKSIADEKFVRSELVYLYLSAFERLKNNKNRKVETIALKPKAVIAPVTKVTPMPVAKVTPMPVTKVIGAKRNYQLPLCTEAAFVEIIGGRNLKNKWRRFNIIMRTGTLSGIKLTVATLGKVSKGMLVAEIYRGRTVIARECFNTEQLGVYSELKWEFPPINGYSGEKLNIRLKYSASDPGEWVCVYEERKPLSIINRIKYKMNFKSSYRIHGIGVFE